MPWRSAPSRPPARKRADTPYHFALATRDKVSVKASTLLGHPTIWIPRAGKSALNLLRLTLLGEL